MKTKYQMNKNELVVELTLKENINLKDDLNYLYNYLNAFIKIKKISFKGSKIAIIINGIYQGTIYLTNYYLNKNYFYKLDNLTEYNSYFIANEILEIKPRNVLI